jgi:hypothetical protein
MTDSDFSFLPSINSESNGPVRDIDPKSLARYFIPRRSVRRALALMCIWMMLAALVLTGAAPANGSIGDAERIHWKAVAVAQVKLDDKTPLAFNVYQPEKKKDSHFVLVLLGRRYIELDIKAKLAYNVLLTDLQKNGNDFESDNLAVPARLLTSTDWSVRDVGPAEQIKVTLGDYGRLLQVDLPHPPDMRAFY